MTLAYYARGAKYGSRCRYEICCRLLGHIGVELMCSVFHVCFFSASTVWNWKRMKYLNLQYRSPIHEANIPSFLFLSQVFCKTKLQCILEKNTLKKSDLQEIYNNCKIKLKIFFCESGPRSISVERSIAQQGYIYLIPMIAAQPLIGDQLIMLSLGNPHTHTYFNQMLAILISGAVHW